MNNLPRTMNTVPRTNRLSSLTCQSIMTSIMQNKPNFKDAKMNLKFFKTRNYKNFIPLVGYKNKPNSKPISNGPFFLLKRFIRIMRRWNKQIRALKLFGEKNRLGRGSNLGQAGGNLCLWGPERFFSIVRNAQYIYQLFGRATKTANFFQKNFVSEEKAGENRLFGHLLQLFRNRTSNSLRITEKVLNSEKALHSVSLVAHVYNLCYFIFQGWI